MGCLVKPTSVRAYERLRATLARASMIQTAAHSLMRGDGCIHELSACLRMSQGPACMHTLEGAVQ